MSARHVPVLLDRVIAAVAPADGERFIDGTFGDGGYSRALLEAADVRVFAIDRDPEAIARGREFARHHGERLILIEGRFSEMERLLEPHGVRQVAGIALDIGVSSAQLADPERGFSFMSDGPLDMRMGAEGRTAADIVNAADEETLAAIFRDFGGERHAWRIARALVAARRQAPIERTGRMAEIVSRALGGRRGGGIHPATRVFQALRIAVNDELGELRRGLAAAERMLAPAGRLAVVAFHSLEDAIVKAFLAERAGRLPALTRHRPTPASVTPEPTFHLPRKGAIKPAPDEAADNPRARSARLRIAVRTAAPAWKEAA